MIDWEKFSVPPTKERLMSYPTVLEILEDIVAEEETAQAGKLPLRRRYDYFYDFTEKGRHLLVDYGDCGLKLMPLSRTPFVFYRGQNHYYSQCRPSLLRFSGALLERETLRSYCQTAEMKRVMRVHPIISFLEGLNFCGRQLRIPYEGLAQHYGINTFLLDLTNDIWVAAFFAAARYSNGKYVPYVIDGATAFEDCFGVLYRLDYGMKKEQFIKSEIYPVGLHYFNRPGRQNAFTVEANDFHNMQNLERVYFRHDNQANKLIFTLCQHGLQFFPDDSLARIVSDIRNSNSVSRGAISEVRDSIFPFVSEKMLESMVADVGLVVSDGLGTAFSESQIEKDCREWFGCGGRKRFMNNIIMCNVMMLDVPRTLGNS